MMGYFVRTCCFHKVTIHFILRALFVIADTQRASKEWLILWLLLRYLKRLVKFSISLIVSKVVKYSKATSNEISAWKDYNHLSQFWLWLGVGVVISEIGIYEDNYMCKFYAVRYIIWVYPDNIFILIYAQANYQNFTKSSA